MKRNLIVLILLLTVASVVARVNHNRESRKAREQAKVLQDALVEDLQHGLQALWGEHRQSVSVRDAVVAIDVKMPPQADPSWNQALAGFVLRLHPQVKIDRVEIRGANARPAPGHLTKESELATRQAQTQVDSWLGSDRALALVDVRTETRMHQQGLDASGPGLDGKWVWRSGVGPTTYSKEKVRHIYFVLPTAPGSVQEETLRELVKPNQALEEDVKFVSWR